MMLNRPNLTHVESPDGTGNGRYGSEDGDGYGHGYKYGYVYESGYKSGYESGYGYGKGYGNPNGVGLGAGNGQLGYRTTDLAENPYCTRLLTNRYPDINFYICQLQLLKGRSP